MKIDSVKLNHLSKLRVSLSCLVLSLFMVTKVTAEESVTTLNEIENFRIVSKQLASSGMPSDKALMEIKNAGFQHVINLIPGDYEKEKALVESLDMSFEQIEVNWNKPKLQDFQRFVLKLKQTGNDKVLVHCRLNYRASAFVYLYQVTQKRHDQENALEAMHSVWRPKGVWLDYIKSVEQHYK